MSDTTGKWLPDNLDGTAHDCRSSPSPPSSLPLDTFATIATTTKEIEKEDDRPMNEEEIEIETNDPTIKAILNRLNHMEEKINQLLVKFDHLNVRAKSLLIATAVCSLALASILSMTPAARATLSPDDEVSTPQVWCVDNSQGNDWTDGC